MKFDATFDFRHEQHYPYTNPDTGISKHQYSIHGIVKKNNEDSIEINCEGEREYHLICKKTSFGSFEGIDRNVSLRICQIGHNEYVGVWKEDEYILALIIEEA